MVDFRTHVYFPVESLVGLGHFNRSGKLVREMVRAGMEVTVASGSFVDPGRFFAGADCRTLPQIVRREKGAFVTLDADGKRTVVPNFNEAARTDARIAAHAQNIAGDKPDLLITEYWPFNRASFDREMLAVLTAAGKDALKVVSLRDVLDTPDPGKVDEKTQAARESFVVKTINENYDAVLVHGDPHFIPLSETFAAAGRLKVPVIYTGYVIDELPKRAPVIAPDAPILLSCGSGVEGEQLVYSFLSAWQRLAERRDDPEAAAFTRRPLHIVCGPRFEGQAFKDVRERTAMLKKDYGCDVTLDQYRNDFTTLLAGAGFSVSLAGYNTTLETLAMQVPALLVPKYSLREDGGLKTSTEQMYRLQRLEQNGMAAWSEPAAVQNVAAFADRLLAEFKRQALEQKPKTPLDFSGAATSLAALTQLLDKKKQAPAKLAV